MLYSWLTFSERSMVDLMASQQGGPLTSNLG